jgi:hypothetical protein
LITHAVQRLQVQLIRSRLVGQRTADFTDWRPTRYGFVSHIDRKKPKGHAMSETMRRANNAKSKIRARVEHVFAEQKHRMGLFVRTIGIARATTKIGMANLVYIIFLRNTSPSHDRLVLRKSGPRLNTKFQSS